MSKYPVEFVNLDIDSYLSNKRLLYSYLDCFLGKKKCTANGRQIKREFYLVCIDFCVKNKIIFSGYLPDAINNDCAKCTEMQRKLGEKVLKYLLDNEPQKYKELEQKYDPEGKYRAKYQKEKI